MNVDDQQSTQTIYNMCVVLEFLWNKIGSVFLSVYCKVLNVISQRKNGYLALPMNRLLEWWIIQIINQQQ